MVALRINVFGGMIPAQDDHLLPDGGASLAQNTWLYSGALEGFKTTRYIRNLTSATAKRVYRIPNDPYEKTNFNNSFWLEFQDADVEVLRAPVRDDSYQRYYWVGPSTTPAYNTYSRIASGLAAYKLGIPQPATAMTVNAPVTPDDTVAPVATSATINGALVTIFFTEERRLDALNVPPKTAFRITSPSREFEITSLAVDGPNRKIGLLLDTRADPNEVVTVAYTKPSSGNDLNAIQDEAGNDAASFTLTCTNDTLDKTGPVFEKAHVTDAALTIWFTDANPLSTTNLPNKSVFEVISNGSAVTINSYTVDASAKAVVLTLARNIEPGETTYVSYTDPTFNNDITAIQDTAGNDAQSFYRKLVVNFSTDKTRPTFEVAACLYNIVNIKFSEELSANIPGASRFAVWVNGVSYTPTSVAIDGPNRMVGLTIAHTTLYGEVVSVTYNDVAGSSPTPITDLAGNTAVGFTTKPVRNDNPYFAPYDPNSGGGGGGGN